MKNTQFNRDLVSLLDQIEMAFSNVTRPPLCQDILTQKDFERAFWGDELGNTIRHLYDYDEGEIHYLTPFLMRAYIRWDLRNSDLDVDFADYLFWFDGFKREVQFIRDRYMSFYMSFNDVQTDCICSFLKFLRKYEMDKKIIDDDMLKFWCRSA
ncbi:MAG: hypothetical protein KF855_11705 [Acidobacteria bacterium]|nr:hypothetical protein [Acidobacteriota bacterium]